MYLDMANSTLRTSWVSTALDPKNPMGHWTAPKALRSKETVCGQVLSHSNQIYFVWSAPGSVATREIYIAPMKNPIEIETNHPDVLLYTPSEPWECVGDCNSVARSSIYNRGWTYLIYSTSHSPELNGSLSYLSIPIDANPLLPSNWKRAPGPMFTGNHGKNVYEPFYATFTGSHGNTELWMLYNAADTNSSGRTARIEKVKFNVETGAPEFPAAHGAVTPQREPSGERPMFSNPISNQDMLFPSIYKDANKYYIVYVNENSTGIDICSSEEPIYFDCADATTIFSLPNGHTTLHMVKIREVDDDLYLYLSYKPVNGTQGVFVAKALNKSDPTGDWTPPYPLDSKHTENMPLVSPDIVRHDTKLYLIFESRQNIFISEMDNATTAIGLPVLIKVPTETWSCKGGCTNHAPSAVNLGNMTFLAYSASDYFTGNESYSMSYLSIQTGRDPLDATSWMPETDPVFVSNLDEDVIGVGHGSLFSSPDGTETWLLYVSSTSNQTTSRRKPSIEKLSWDGKTGHPIFPKPHGAKHKQPIASVAKYFANPVIDTSTKTSSILKLGSFYYMAKPSNDDREIVILKSGKLTDFKGVEQSVVYRIPSGYNNINSPELHVVNGDTFLYFSMENSSQVSRLFAIKADISNDPMASWSTATRHIDNVWEFESTDSTLTSINQKVYLVWRSPNPQNGFNSIYVTEMENATSSRSTPVLLREPVESWECVNKCDLGAPALLFNDNKHFLVYSASPSCSDGYSLGWMSIEDGKDPLDGINWTSAAGPFFQSDSSEEVFCPGHVSFTSSPNDQEIWMAYHATSYQNDTNQNVRIEMITFDEHGNPIFPTPHGSSSPQLVPSFK